MDQLADQLPVFDISVYIVFVDYFGNLCLYLSPKVCNSYQ